MIVQKGGASEHASDNSVRWLADDSLTAPGHWATRAQGQAQEDTLVLRTHNQESIRLGHWATRAQCQEDTLVFRTHNQEGSSTPCLTNFQ